MTRSTTFLFARETLLRSGYELSTNHMARALSELGHRVFWITRPLTPISVLGAQGRSTLGRRWKIWMRHWSGDPGQQICLLSGLARKRKVGLTGRWLLRNLYRVTFPSVSSALNRRGLTGVDVLCLSDPIQTGLRHFVPHQRLLFQVTDDYSQFDNYGEDIDAELEATLQACSDILFTNDELRQLYVERHRLNPARCHYVSHGLDRLRIRDDVGVADRIEAVFVGNINEWLDWDWLRAVANRVPRLRVHFFGPLNSEQAGALRHPSFKYRGFLPPTDRPETLAKYHLGLIPFRPSPLKRCSDPMKLFDYAACGLPILSTIRVHRRFHEAFPVGLKVAGGLADAISFLDEIDSDYPALRFRHADDCRRFAATNRWKDRAEQLLALIDPVPESRPA